MRTRSFNSRSFGSKLRSNSRSSSKSKGNSKKTKDKDIVGLTSESVFSPSSPTEEQEEPSTTNPEEVAADQPIEMLHQDFLDTTAAAKQQTQPKKKRKPMWKSVVDPATGRLYYYHRTTRETTWIKPKELRSDNITSVESLKTRSFPNMRFSKDTDVVVAGVQEQQRVRSKNNNEFSPSGQPKQRSQSFESSYPRAAAMAMASDKHEMTKDSITSATMTTSSSFTSKKQDSSAATSSGIVSITDTSSSLDIIKDRSYLGESTTASYTDTTASFPTTCSRSTLVTRNITKRTKSGMTRSFIGGGRQRSRVHTSSNSSGVGVMQGSRSTISRQSMTDGGQVPDSLITDEQSIGSATSGILESSVASISRRRSKYTNSIVSSNNDSAFKEEKKEDNDEDFVSTSLMDEQDTELTLHAPEEVVLEGQEVLLIEEAAPTSLEPNEEELQDGGGGCKEEGEEKRDEPLEVRDLINDPIIDLNATEKKKKRYKKFTPKALGRKMSSSNREANLNATIQKVVNDMECGDIYPPDVAKPIAPKKPKRARKRSTTSSVSGRVVLLPEEHTVQEAAWNEEQARQLLYKALHTSNVDKRKELCQDAFSHAHDALRLRNEAHDEKIGLVIDPKTQQNPNSSRAGDTFSTVTPAIFDTRRTYWSKDDTAMEDSIVESEYTYETNVLDRIQVIQAFDELCVTACGDDDYVLDNDESVLL